MVWRGVDKDLSDVYMKHKQKKTRLRDWRFSSTSTDMEVVKRFLKDGPRTLFAIYCKTGVVIKEFSAFPTENEVVLMPGVQYVVKNVAWFGHGLIIVELSEVKASRNFCPGSAMLSIELEQEPEPEEEVDGVAAQMAAMQVQMDAAAQVAESERIAAEQVADAQRDAAEQVAEAESKAAEQVAEAERRAAEQVADAQRDAAEQVADAQRDAAEQVAEAESKAAEHMPEYEPMSPKDCVELERVMGLFQTALESDPNSVV